MAETCTKMDIINSSQHDEKKKPLEPLPKVQSKLCCICGKLPSHVLTYYGRKFCVDCFYKYIRKDPKPCEGV